MNIRIFILIIALKLLAIQIICFGIYCEFKANAPLGNIIITVGSLIFAIACNTTLFCVVSSHAKSKKKEAKNECSNDEDFNCCTSFDRI